MYGFLIIHVMITLLEFEQALKNFLDLKIYRVFIKQFDQIKRKTKKIHKKERRDKECRDTFFSPSPKCMGSWPGEPSIINL